MNWKLFICFAICCFINETTQNQDFLLEFDNQLHDNYVGLKDTSYCFGWRSNIAYSTVDVGKQRSFNFQMVNPSPIFNSLVDITIGWTRKTFLFGYGMPFDRDENEFWFGLRWKEDTQGSNDVHCLHDCDRCYKPVMNGTGCTIRKENITVTMTVQDISACPYSPYHWKLAMTVAN